MGLWDHGLVGDGVLRAVCSRPERHLLFQRRQIRQLFVTPNAAEREIFYGVNFEFSYAMPQFSDTRWNVEIRPIIGVRKGDYEFIVNPIVDFGFGQNGDLIFAPAARFARKLGENLSVGVEYYSDLGAFPNFATFNEQQHNIYAVVDFKIGRFDVNAGVGYGLTPGSDRLMAKMIIGTDFNEGLPTPRPRPSRCGEQAPFWAAGPVLSVVAATARIDGAGSAAPSHRVLAKAPISVAHCPRRWRRWSRDRSLDRGDVADRIEVGHVERIVRAHDDAVGAELAHQLGELVGVNTTVSK